jgi:hypothetical protein
MIHLTLINAIILFFFIVLAIIGFRYYIKKSNGWNPSSILYQNNIKEVQLPFTITNDDVYFFNNGNQKLILHRNGSLRIINSSGFRKWSTPKEKNTNTGSTKVVFDKTGIEIKRNLLTVYSYSFPVNLNAVKLVFTDEGNLNVLDDKNNIIWSSNKKYELK